jgi:nucleoside-diphosphate-sugar epimerase
MTSQELVLVTGGSGFVGAHCIVAALKQGYRVRTTIRSLKREDEVREMLRVGGVTDEQAKSVEFVAADLTKDEGWNEACQNCSYVLHVASPFPAEVPKHADELIVPARDGTLRVLEAAKAAGTVKRVVVTSSLAAICEYSNCPPPRTLFLT